MLNKLSKLENKTARCRLTLWFTLILLLSFSIAQLHTSLLCKGWKLEAVQRQKMFWAVRQGWNREPKVNKDGVMKGESVLQQINTISPLHLIKCVGISYVRKTNRHSAQLQSTTVYDYPSLTLKSMLNIFLEPWRHV